MDLPPSRPFPPPRLPARRAAAGRAAPATALALVGALLAGGRVASAGKEVTPPAAPGPVNLRTNKILDLPTTVSVPISAEQSVVLSIPGRMFLQCPRNAPVPTTFWADGLILQDVWNSTTGNTLTMVYVGTMPLPAADLSVPFAERFARMVPSFVAGLQEKYARVDFRLLTDPASIKLEKATVKVDGKPVPAFRTSRYHTTPGTVNKPGAQLVSEAVFFGAPSAEALVYVVMDSKGKAMPLEKVLDGLSIRRTSAVNPAGRVVALNDVSYGTDGRWPVRLGWYTSPPGFAPTQDTVRTVTELVYAEERLDAKGVVTGAYRIEHRDGTPGKTLEQELEIERASHQVQGAGAPRAVDLAPGSGQALVLTHRTKVADRAASAQTSVIVVDDKVWTFTWTTFGDEALAKADAAAFDALLRGMSLAIR